MTTVKDLIAKVYEDNCAEGKRLEVGTDTWQCAGEEVTGRGFVGDFAKTLKELYDFIFAEHDIKTAIFHEGEVVTYEQLSQRTKKMAAVMVETLKINQGDSVVICTRNFPEWVVCFLATTYIGAVAVPLDLAASAPMMEAAVRATKAKLLIVDNNTFKQAFKIHSRFARGGNMKMLLVKHAIKPQLYSRLGGVFDGTVLMEDAEPREAGDFGSNPSDTAVIIASNKIGHYVELSHKGMIAQAKLSLLQYEIQKIFDPREHQIVSLCSHDLPSVIGLCHFMLESLVNGTKMILINDWNAARALTQMNEQEVNCLTTTVDKLQDIFSLEDFKSNPPATLKQIKLFQENGCVSEENLTSLRAGLGDIQATFSQGYFSRETNGGITRIFGPDYYDTPSSVGAPHSMVQVCVIDPKDANPEKADIGKNIVGELLVKSCLVMKGYYQNPASTAACFVTVQGAGGGNGWYRTGQPAMIGDDGKVYLVKDQA